MSVPNATWDDLTKSMVDWDIQTVFFECKQSRKVILKRTQTSEIKTAPAKEVDLSVRDGTGGELHNK